MILHINYALGVLNYRSRQTRARGIEIYFVTTAFISQYSNNFLRASVDSEHFESFKHFGPRMSASQVTEDKKFWLLLLPYNYQRLNWEFATASRLKRKINHCHLARELQIQRSTVYFPFCQERIILKTVNTRISSIIMAPVEHVHSYLLYHILSKRQEHF